MTKAVSVWSSSIGELDLTVYVEVEVVLLLRRRRQSFDRLARCMKYTAESIHSTATARSTIDPTARTCPFVHSYRPFTAHGHPPL